MLLHHVYLVIFDLSETIENKPLVTVDLKQVVLLLPTE